MNSDLTFEKISSYFHLPINEASRELRVCATILKKICRANNITRWPHRKIRSLDNMISVLKGQLDSAPSEQEIQRILREIQDFEAKKAFITRNPNIEYKSVVPKSTLQSFSKSKTKKNNKYLSNSKSGEEEALEVLAHLKSDISSKSLVNNQNNNNMDNNNIHNTHFHNNQHFVNTIDNNNVNNLNNNMNNGTYHGGSYTSSFTYTPIKLPPKKQILKMERERTEKLKLYSQPIISHTSIIVDNSFSPSPNNNLNNHLLDQLNDNNNQNNNTSLSLSTPIDNNNTTTNNNNDYSTINSNNYNGVSIVSSFQMNEDQTSSISSVIQPNDNNANNIQIISFSNMSESSSLSSKKRKYDDMEGLNEFNKYKASFSGNIKFQRIWEPSPLVFIKEN